MNTTIADRTVYLSKKGIKELKKTLIQLEHDKNKELQLLRDLDKTNGREERLERIDRLANLEGIEIELDEKKSLLANAKLIPSKRTRLQVAIGSVVELLDNRGRKYRYTIVDSVEANPSDGRISNLSPIGQNLIGKTVQDMVKWKNGTKTICFKLVKIL